MPGEAVIITAMYMLTRLPLMPVMAAIHVSALTEQLDVPWHYVNDQQRDQVVHVYI